MAARESKEERVRKKILLALKQRINGSSALLRQYEINKIVGKTSVRAPYLQALLAKMQEEELIDCHWRAGGKYWALFNHPDNIKGRELREQHRIESERLAPIFAERERKWKAERAAYEAKQRFHRNFEQFLANNYDEIFDVMCRIYRNYSPKAQWLHSRQYL
jgi:hypothetical protein